MARELKCYFFELNSETTESEIRAISLDELKRLNPKLPKEAMQEDCLLEGSNFGDVLYSKYSFISSRPQKIAVGRMRRFIEDVEALEYEAYEFSNDEC